MNKKIFRLALILSAFLLVMSISTVAMAQGGYTDMGIAELKLNLLNGMCIVRQHENILVGAINYLFGDVCSMRPSSVSAFSQDIDPRIDQVMIGLIASIAMFIGVLIFIIGAIQKKVSITEGAQNSVSESSKYLIMAVISLIALMPSPVAKHYPNGFVVMVQLATLGGSGGEMMADYGHQRLTSGSYTSGGIQTPKGIINDSLIIGQSFSCIASKYKEGRPIATYRKLDGSKGVVNPGDKFSALGDDIDKLYFGVNRQGVGGDCGSINFANVEFSDKVEGESHFSGAINPAATVIQKSKAKDVARKEFTKTFLTHMDDMLTFIEGSNSVFFDDYSTVLKNNPHYRYTLAPGFASSNDGEANIEEFGDERAIKAFNEAVVNYGRLMSKLGNDSRGDIATINAAIVEGSANYKAYFEKSPGVLGLPYAVQAQKNMHQYVGKFVETSKPVVSSALLTCSSEGVTKSNTFVGKLLSSARESYAKANAAACDTYFEVQSLASGMHAIHLTYREEMSEMSYREDDFMNVSYDGFYCGTGGCTAKEVADHVELFIASSVRMTIMKLTDWVPTYNALIGQEIESGNDGYSPTDIHSKLRDVGTTIYESSITLWGAHAILEVLDRSVSELPMGIGSVLGLFTGLAAAAVKTAFMVSVYFAGMAPMLIAVIPNVINVTYTFAVMSWIIMIYVVSIATILFAVRGFFPEGAGIIGSRWERQLVNVLGMIFFLPIVILGYFLYEEILPWFYVIIAFMFRSMVLVSPNLVTLVIVACVVIFWQINVMMRNVVWLGSMLIFLPDKIFNAIGAPFEMNSSSQSIQEMTSDARGSVEAGGGKAAQAAASTGMKFNQAVGNTTSSKGSAKPRRNGS